jgi:hypothetical protein
MFLYVRLFVSITRTHCKGTDFHVAGKSGLRWRQGSAAVGYCPDSSPPGEGELFAAPLKIYTTGLTKRSSAKPETIESYFFPWGRIKGEGGRKYSFH